MLLISIPEAAFIKNSVLYDFSLFSTHSKKVNALSSLTARYESNPTITDEVSNFQKMSFKKNCFPFCQEN